MSKYPGKVISNLAPAGYSVFFDGTGDSLSTASNAAFGFGTGDATIEAWIYPNTVSGTQVLIDTRVGVGVAGVGLYLSNATLSVARDSNNVLMQGGTVTANTWSHVAWTRSGSTNRLFLNGVQTASATDSTNYPTARCFVGSNDGNVQNLNGYISNARVLKGTALYTAAFTPPTQLFNITNTSLLTCNSPAIVDQSTNAFAITANGNAAVSTLTPFTAYVPYNPALGASTPGIWTLDEALQAAATRQWNMYDPSFNLTTLLLHGNPTNGTSFITDASTNNFTVTPVADARAANLSPFSLTTFATSGSGYFDGTGDYLTVANNTALQFGSGDFTIEFWWYPNATGDQNLISKWNSATEWILQWRSAGNFRWAANGAVVRDANYTLATGTWIHVAVSCVSTNLRIFVNGTQIGTTATQSSITGTSEAVTIGAGQISSTPLAVNGYISNVRLVKGVGVYTGNFTTPTAPLTATQAAGTNISAITGTQTSLLTLQNSQSANNNAFLDSSSNNFLITRNGNTTQGSFSPFSAQPGAWSSYYSGVADTNGTYFAANAAYSFGTGDFTVEAWINIPPISNTNGKAIVDSRPSGFNGSYWFFGFTNTGQLTGITMTTGGTTITSTSAIPTNQWVHVAYTRASGTLNLWVNGVSVASATGNTNNISSDTLWVGRNAFSGVASDTWFSGYMSNLRIVKGVAVYTGTFTPPASPLEKTQSAGINIAAITGSQTSLLFNQSNRFVDNSNTNATPLTLNTWPTIQSFSPFYPTRAYTPQTIGGSGYFDGTGDYLSSATSTDLQLGSSDFSLEWWEYRTAANNVDTAIVCGDGTFSALLGYYNSGAVRFYLSTTGSSWNVFSDTSAGTTASNSWNHFVLTRSGTAFRVFLNGVLGAYATGSGSVTQTTNQIFISGGINGSSVPIEGYMSGVRFVKGSIPISYQTSSTTTNTPIFTPPTAPVTTTSQGATSGDVKYLVNFTNAGVVDSTGKNVFETTGNAQITTALSRFGGSSIFFDGTGDALFIPPNQKENLRFGTGDFTIEFWAWKSANGSTNFDGVISVTPDGTFNGGFGVELSSSRGFCFLYDSAVRVQSVINPNDSTWHHYAVVRSGSTFALYRDGVQLTTATLTPTLGIAGNAYIGGVSSATANNFNGYIDELRVTRGFARYTGNFTPQTSQWQDQ